MGASSTLVSRFEQINRGTHRAPSTDFFQDDVYAFFQNCYLLKDWLKNDRATRTIVSDVEDVINASPELLLCGALANGSKHLGLSDPRFDSSAQIHRRDATVTVGVGVAVRYHVSAGGTTFDAFDIATKSLAKWRSYLSSKNLL